MTQLVMETGVRWKCRNCGAHQEPVEHEEWPEHCSMSMKLAPWYRLSKAGGEEEQA